MITADHKQKYQADGCVRIEGAFGADWIDLLTAAFDRCQEKVRAGEPIGGAFMPGVLPADGDYDAARGTSHLRNAAPNDAKLWSWVSDSPAAEIVGALTGAQTVQFWYDLWFCKEPASGAGEGSATPWHHDASGHPFSGDHMPSLWVALTDVTEDDAPLLTYKGSHKDPRFFRPPYVPGKENTPTPDDYGKNEEMLETVAAHPENVETWTCKAGDALLLHPLTWHGSLPQAASGRRRLACTTRWIGTDLVWDPKPFSFDGYFTGAADLKPGARPPVDFLPVVWRAGAPEAG